MEEAATPLPSEETTPPVTKIYFGAIRAVHEFKRGLIGPPQVTYKELWMLGEKLSIAKLWQKLNSHDCISTFRRGTFCASSWNYR
jgi:hypothetical protein